MKNEEYEIAQKIRQRRAQILIHSVIYYKFDDNIVPDWQYDKWGKELIELQEKYPEISKKVKYYYEEFSKFSGTTSGYDLPLHDLKLISTARFVLRVRDKRRAEGSVA